MLKLRTVPNAPCGVERFLLGFYITPTLPVVPNAPCGVERQTAKKDLTKCWHWFLMHRVELKELL